MPGKRYGIYESIGSGREAVIDYDDLSNHHPSKHFHEKGRVYETVDGRKEEVVLRDGHTLVSKDFVLYDSTCVKKLSDISVAAKQVPVPAPFSGVVEVNRSQALMIIRDAKTGETMAQIRHMDAIRFSESPVIKAMCSETRSLNSPSDKFVVTHEDDSREYIEINTATGAVNINHHSKTGKHALIEMNQWRKQPAKITEFDANGQPGKAEIIALH